MSHFRGLYKTEPYKELYDFINGFSLDAYLKKNEDTKKHDFFNNKLLHQFDSHVKEYVKIVDLASTVYAEPNDEARLRRLFTEISEFVDRRPDLFV